MEYTTIFNEKVDTPCIGCYVTDKTKFNEGRIFQSKLWNVSQDFEIAYPGMIILSPLRHVSFYMDLTDDELKELKFLTVYCKKAIQKIFNCEKAAYMFYEKPNSHIHFIVIPLHGLIEIKDKYSILGELMAKTEDLRTDKENMARVTKAINGFREYFANI